MVGYTKLFSSILASSIWNEDAATRCVWVTMLAMKDRDGVVEGSIPGLAVLARVTVEECRKAIEILSAPDPDSRTKTNDGRRIEPHADGWLVINHDLYQERGSAEDAREKTRRRVERHRARKAGDVTLGNDAKRMLTVEMTSTSTPIPTPTPTSRKSPEGGGVSPIGGGGGDRGSESDEQANLFAVLCGTTVRSKSKSRRVALSRIAVSLEQQGMRATELRSLWTRARQESAKDPGGLLLHWLENGWREKVKP